MPRARRRPAASGSSHSGGSPPSSGRCPISCRAHCGHCIAWVRGCLIECKNIDGQEDPEGPAQILM
eukprot:14390687-Alexandrium_andersonii.AAC.1